MKYGVTGSGTARLLCGQAQSRAGLGDGPGAVAALQRAETVREIDPRENGGEGIYSFREVKQRYYAGSSLLWTDREQDLRHAEREALAAVRTWERSPVDERSLGDEALARVYVALARAQLGELEGTREALAPILDLPEGRRISWIGKRMANVAEIVASERYRRSPAACHLHEELTAYGR